MVSRGVTALLLAAALLFVGASALAPSAAARRTTLVSPRGAPLGAPYQGWVDRSLVPTPAGRVTVHLARCPGATRAAGCVKAGRLDAFYLNPAAPRKKASAFHELGHLFDFTTMRDEHRRTFASLRRRSGQEWLGGRNPLGEQFAEAYSFCARYREVRRRVGPFATYAYNAGPRQHRRACSLVRQAAAAGPAARTPPVPPRPDPG